MKEARLEANLKRTRIALSLGDPVLARALVAELSVAADFEPVAALEAPDLLVTDSADILAEDGVAIVFIRSRHGPAPVRPVRALLPENLDPKRIVDAARLVAAGLLVLPGSEVAESETVEASEDRGAPHLTSREREVLELLAAGAPNKEIARRLGISIHTVKFHMASLLAKLGATSRLEAVGIGLRTGIIMV